MTIVNNSGGGRYRHRPMRWAWARSLAIPSLSILTVNRIFHLSLDSSLVKRKHCYPICIELFQQPDDDGWGKESTRLATRLVLCKSKCRFRLVDIDFKLLSDEPFTHGYGQSDSCIQLHFEIFSKQANKVLSLVNISHDIVHMENHVEK